GVGAYAVPASEKAFAQCDVMLAIGARFGEIPTGSFSMKVPENLIHVDINPAVFNTNYPAKVAIEGDAEKVVPALLEAVKRLSPQGSQADVRAVIAKEKQAYRDEWLEIGRASCRE